MRNKITLSCVIFMFVLGIQVGNGQTSYTVTAVSENAYLDGMPTTTLSPCTPYTFDYTFTTTPTTLTTGTITINFPDGISPSSVYSSSTASISAFSLGSNTATVVPTWSVSPFTFSVAVTTPNCSWPPSGSTTTVTTIISGYPTVTTTTVPTAFSEGNPLLTIPQDPVYYYSYNGSLPTTYSCTTQNIMPGETGEFVVDLRNSGNGGIENLILSTYSTSISDFITYIAINNSSLYAGSSCYGCTTYTPPFTLPVTIANSSTFTFLYGEPIFPSGEDLYIHFGFTVPNGCPTYTTTSVIYDFSTQCGTNTCQSTGTYTTTFQYNDNTAVTEQGNPDVSAITLQSNSPVFLNADYCGSGLGGNSAILGFIYSNNGTDLPCLPRTNASAVMNEVILNVENDFGSIPGGISPTFTLTGPSGTTVTVTGTEVGSISPYYSTYLIDLADNTTDLGTNSLTNLPGNSTSYFNELPPGGTFTVTTNYNYSSTCPYTTDFYGIYGASVELITTDAKYNNEICTLTGEPAVSYTYSSTVLSDYFYSAPEFNNFTNSIDDISLGSPNITIAGGYGEPGPDFTMQFCLGANTQSWGVGNVGFSDFQFSCPNADYQVVVSVPENYELCTTNTLVPIGAVACPPGVSPGCSCYTFSWTSSNPPITAYEGLSTTAQVVITNPITIEDYTQSTQSSSNPCFGSNIVIDFGNLQVPYYMYSDGGYLYVDDINCFNIPLQLDCNCSTLSGWKSFSYSYNYICDNDPSSLSPPPCNLCYDVLSDGTTDLFDHCTGSCNPMATGGISTSYGLYFERTTLGWQYNSTPPYNDWSCVEGNDLSSLLGVMHHVNRADSSILAFNRAYPGDEIEEKMNGDWYPTPGYTTILNSVYLETTWDRLTTGCSGDILTLEPSSYMIIVDHTSSTTTVTTTCTVTPTFISSSTAAGYDVYIDPTIFSNGTWNSSDNISIYADLFWVVKTTSCLAGNIPLPSGKYPLNKLQAEFNATSPSSSSPFTSCDPWVSNFTILQPSVSVGLGSYGPYQGNPPNNIPPNYYLYCEEMWPTLSLVVKGALWDEYVADFPYEFRPYAGLIGPVNITTPFSYLNLSCTGCGTTLYTNQDIYDGSSLNYIYPNLLNYSSSSVLSTTTGSGPVAVNLYPSCSYSTTVWPLLDCNGNGGNYAPRSDIALNTIPQCNAGVGTFNGTAVYQVSTQQYDPLLIPSTIHTFTASPASSPPLTSFTITQVNPSITITTAATVPIPVYTNTVSIPFTIQNTSLGLAPDPWIDVTESSLFWTFTGATTGPDGTGTALTTFITSTGTSTSIFVDYGPFSALRAGDYKNIYVEATLTPSVVPVSDCSPTSTVTVTNIPISYECGNSCIAQAGSITTPDVYCEGTNGPSFNIDWYPSTISITSDDLTSLTFTTCPTEPFTFTFTINNNFPGPTTSPFIWLNLPSGLIADWASFTYSAVTEGSPFSCSTGTVTPTTTYSVGNPQTPEWDLNSVGLLCLSGEILGGGTITATVVVTPECDFAGGSLTAMAGGTVSCGGIVASTYSTVISTYNNCMNLTTSQVNILCNGDNTGTATVSSISGGSPPFTYTWSDASTQRTNPATGLYAGTYTVTVTSVTSETLCAATTVTITQPPQLIVSPSITSVGCTSGGTGSLQANASGGTVPYIYSWSDGTTNSTLSGVTDGTYTVTVTDNNLCTASGTVVLTSLSASISITAINCSGESIGSLNANIFGGTPPYIYSWSTSPVQTNALATGLSTGTYTVEVTDNNGCTATTSLIFNSVTITSSTSVLTNISCNGNTNGEVEVYPGGGITPYTYIWSDAASQTTAIASGLGAGTYTVFVWDHEGCSITNTVTLTQPSPLVATVSITQPEPPCTTSGTAIINASGGTSPLTYYWSPGGNTTSSVSSLASGVYNVEISDANGCSTSVIIIIVTTSSVEVTANVSNVNCTGSPVGTGIANAIYGTLPYTYSWSTTPVQTNASATGLSAGIYTITVTDANGCSATSSVVIGTLSLSTTSRNILCYGEDDGLATVNVSGGTPPFNYNWSPGGATNQTIINLSAGTYTVVVTDGNICSATATVTLTQPDLFGLTTSVTATTCRVGVGTATATLSGGTTPYTYIWSPSGQTTSTATGLTVGIYTIIAEDNNGCLQSTTVNIPSTVSASITTVSNVSCYGENDGSAIVNVSGGTSPFIYIWSSGSTSFAAVGLSAGTYSVTVYDYDGCEAVTTVTITQPSQLIASINASYNITCGGTPNGYISSSASGGVPLYSYNWMPSGGTSNIASGLSAGTYTLVVTDGNGCTAITSSTITEPDVLSTVVTSQNNISCSGDNTGVVTLLTSGGTWAYNYTWSSIGGTSSTASATVTGLSAGTYTVTVTDAHSCTSSLTVTITEPSSSLGTIISAQTNVPCFGGTNGSVDLTTSGGLSPYTYSWIPYGGTSDAATGLVAGTYIFIVTDANGCSVSGTTAITQPPSISLTTTTTATSCSSNTGTASVTVSGGVAPYNYNWSPGGQTTTSITGLSIGIYTITVTDQNGCQQSTDVNIGSAVSASIISSTNILCYGDANGTASVGVAGGIPPYVYSWTSGATTTSVSGLSSGTYTVTVSDNSGCEAIAVVTITQPPLLSESIISQSDVSCSDGSDGYAIATISGGTPYYSYSWTPSGGTNYIGTGLTIGTYTLTTTDDNGCTATTSVTITQPEVLSSSLSEQVNVLCYGSSTGIIGLTTSGGTTPYSYRWSPPEGTSNLATGLSAGTYRVNTYDNNGCVSTLSVIMIQPAKMSYTVTSITDISCTGSNTGSATLTLTGGITPYIYSWAPAGGTTATGTGLSAGFYTITVTDDNGCSISANVAITEPPGTLSVTPNPAQVCAGDITTLCASGMYTYSWSDGETTSCISVSPSSTTTFTVSGTDISGCTETTTAIVEVGTPPPPPAIVGPFYGCGGNYLVNSTVSGATYTWNATGTLIGYPTTGTWPTNLWPYLAFGGSGGTLSVTTSYTTTPWCTSTSTYTIIPCCTSTDGRFVIGDESASQILGGSIFSGVNILVNGTFTVDQYTELWNCDVQFTPGSSILVMNNSELSLGCPTTTHLYAACNGMWNGILVYPGSTLLACEYALIEDADTAVYALNSPTSQGVFRLGAVTFNKNLQDIVIGDVPNPYTGFAYNCVFTCRDLSPSFGTHSWYSYWGGASFDHLLPPFTTQRSNIGIQASNVKFWDAFFGNFFDYHDYGIYAYESNINVFGNTFENITHFHSFGTETGVFSYSTYFAPGHTLIVGDMTSGYGNTFTDCYYGVRAGYLTNVQVENNTFDNSRYHQAFENAIGESEGSVLIFDPPIILNILNNTIYNAKVGINVFDNHKVSAGLIAYNTITNPACASMGYTAIQASEIAGTGGRANYNIDVNNISTQTYGITTTNLYGVDVVSNNINLGMSGGCPPSYYAGDAVQALSSTGENIDCNIIQTNPIVNRYDGILESQSTTAIMRQNYVKGASQSIEFNSSPFGGDNLWQNTLSTGAIGIVTTLYSMNHAPMGAPLNGTDNSFSAFSSYEVCAPLVSAYWCSICPTVFCPMPINTASRGHEHCTSIPRVHRSFRMPFRLVLDSLSIDSLIVDSLASGALQIGMDSIVVDTFNIAPDSAAISLMQNIARNEVLYPELQDTNSVLDKEGVVEILWRNPILINSNNIFRSFNDSISSASMGKILAIDTTINTVANPSSYSLLLDSLNSINPANNIEANLQIVESSYLSYLINDSLSAAQLGRLRILANKCPDWDGNGVYKARALLIPFDSAGTIYNDSCGNNNPNRSPHNMLTTSSDTTKSINDVFNLYPNPSNGGFTLTYKINSGQSGEFMLYTLVGEKVADYKLNSGKDKMYINATDLSAGIYLYSISVNNNVMKRDKMIVIK